MTTPRLLTLADAAEYCGLAPTTFANWVAAGRLPRALDGTRRWDRRAIDAKLDQMSGLTPSIAPAENPVEAWKREREAQKAKAAAGAR